MRGPWRLCSWVTRWQGASAADVADSPSMTGTLRILFVEDDPNDVALAVRELDRSGVDYEAVRVDSADDFVDGLRSWRPDLVISDSRTSTRVRHAP
jgi:hypothetical protein